MKKKYILCIIYLVATYNHYTYTCLVGKKAPDFIAQAITQNNTHMLHLDDIKESVVLLFYPKDFTFVCPTELRAFQERMKDLRARNVSIIGISTDTIETHKKWLNTPIKKGGISDITFPLVSDEDGKISRSYNVLNCKDNLAFRGIVIMDKNHTIQSMTINNNPLGRNVDEAIRVIDAIKETEEHGTVCPANWHKGARAMKPTQAGLREYVKETVK